MPEPGRKCQRNICHYCLLTMWIEYTNTAQSILLVYISDSSIHSENWLITFMHLQLHMKIVRPIKNSAQILHITILQ